MPVPDVKFVEQDDKGPCHKYLLDGREIPGLSYILSSCGFVGYNGVKQSVMDAAAERGDAAHYATRLYDEDNPKHLEIIDTWQANALTMPLDEWTRSRLVGWIKFRKDLEFTPLLVEKPMSCELNGMAYGMTPDRYGICKLGNAVVELKAVAEMMPSHAIQTAAQAIAFEDEKIPVARIGLQLTENDYRLHEYKDRQDKRIFGCALACVHWRWQKGIR